MCMPYLQVIKVCQPLDDLRDLAASDSVDTFVLSYTSLLQVRTVHCHLLLYATALRASLWRSWNPTLVTS